MLSLSIFHLILNQKTNVALNCQSQILNHIPLPSFSCSHVLLRGPHLLTRGLVGHFTSHFLIKAPNYMDQLYLEESRGVYISKRELCCSRGNYKQAFSPLKICQRVIPLSAVFFKATVQAMQHFTV